MSRLLTATRTQDERAVNPFELPILSARDLEAMTPEERQLVQIRAS